MYPFGLKAVADRLRDRSQWWQGCQVVSIAILGKLLHGMELLRFFLFLAHSIEDVLFCLLWLMIPDSVVDVALFILFFIQY